MIKEKLQVIFTVSDFSKQSQALMDLTIIFSPHFSDADNLEVKNILFFSEKYCKFGKLPQKKQDLSKSDLLFFDRHSS